MGNRTRIVIGFDIGDRTSVAFRLDRATGEIRELPAVKTTRKAVGAFFDGLAESATVVLETGTHARWIALEGRKRGHEVFVADARRLAAVTQNVRKCDEHDAAILAQLGASDLGLLRPAFVRGDAFAQDLAVLWMRDACVSARTLLVNACRGQAKSLGERLPSCSTPRFVAKLSEEGISDKLRPVLDEALSGILALDAAIEGYDAQIAAACERHPAAQRLADEVPGVGKLTALCFVLTIADPARFRNVRDAAAYVGLVPAMSQSGASDRQMRISKAGNALLRRLLVQCAHHVMGPFGKESDLRTWGLSLAARGGRSGKKRAVVAVARKLAVLMLSLWKSGEAYEAVRTRGAPASPPPGVPTGAPVPAA